MKGWNYAAALIMGLFGMANDLKLTTTDISTSSQDYDTSIQINTKKADQMQHIKEKESEEIKRKEEEKRYQPETSTPNVFDVPSQDKLQRIYDHVDRTSQIMNSQAYKDVASGKIDFNFRKK